MLPRVGPSDAVSSSADIEDTRGVAPPCLLHDDAAVADEDDDEEEDAAADDDAGIERQSLPNTGPRNAEADEAVVGGRKGGDNKQNPFLLKLVNMYKLSLAHVPVCQCLVLRTRGSVMKI